MCVLGFAACWEKKKTFLFRKVRMFLESEDILAAQHNVKGLFEGEARGLRACVAHFSCIDFLLL